jgi:hypothetical protein
MTPYFLWERSVDWERRALRRESLVSNFSYWERFSWVMVFYKFESLSESLRIRSVEAPPPPVFLSE